MDDDVLHVWLAFAYVVLEAAAQVVGLRQCHVRWHGDADEYDQALNPARTAISPASTASDPIISPAKWNALDLSAADLYLRAVRSERRSATCQPTGQRR